MGEKGRQKWEQRSQAAGYGGESVGLGVRNSRSSKQKLQDRGQVT